MEILRHIYTARIAHRRAPDLRAAFTAPGLAAPPADFQTSLIMGDGLDGPSGFEIAPDGRIFILERAGKIKIVKDGELLPTPFADLPSEDTGDRGLIGIAFDPSSGSPTTTCTSITRAMTC